MVKRRYFLEILLIFLLLAGVAVTAFGIVHIVQHAGYIRSYLITFGGLVLTFCSLGWMITTKGVTYKKYRPPKKFYVDQDINLITERRAKQIRGEEFE